MGLNIGTAVIGSLPFLKRADHEKAVAILLEPYGEVREIENRYDPTTPQRVVSANVTCFANLEELEAGTPYFAENVNIARPTMASASAEALLKKGQDGVVKYASYTPKNGQIGWKFVDVGQDVVKYVVDYATKRDLGQLPKGAKFSVKGKIPEPALDQNEVAAESWDEEEAPF